MLKKIQKKSKIVIAALLLFFAAPKIIAQQSNYETNQRCAYKQGTLTTNTDSQYDARTFKAASLCLIAKKFLDSKDYDAAFQLYAQACKLDPNANSATAHTNLGFVFQCLGNYDKAIVEYKKAMQFDPNMEIARTDLAFCLIKQAILLEENHSLSEAQATYEQACKLDPNKQSAIIHNNLANLLSYGDRRDEAIGEYTKSLSFNPKYDLATINIASIYASLGQLDKAKQYYSKYVDEHPEGTRILEAREYLQDIAIAGTGLSQHDIANDYLGKVLGAGVIIWPKSAMPLKVFIESGDNIDGYQDSFKDALISCFDQWTKASNNRISWQLASEEHGADIVCSWTSEPKENFNKDNIHSQAWTTWHLVAGKNGVRLMNHAIIKICTKNALSGKLVWLEYLRAACLHEVGHALGILTHSPVCGDVMFKSTYPLLPIVKLSARDIATLSGLYDAGDTAQAETPTTVTGTQ